MQGDDVTLGVQLVQLHVFRKARQRRIGMVGVGQDFTAKAAEIPDDGGADLAGADDADSQAPQFPAHEAVQGEVVDQRPADGDLGLAEHDEHHHDGEIRHIIRGVMGVVYMDTQFFGRRCVDVVVADGAGGDMADALLGHGLQ